MSPEHDTYLREHRWGLLATTRASGAPQVTMVAYHWDGTDAVVSCRRSSAKAANARRRPDVVLSVPDGRRFLSVAGTAETIDTGQALAILTDRVLASLEPGDAAVLQREIDAGLEAVGRVILRIVPSSAHGRI